MLRITPKTASLAMTSTLAHWESSVTPPPHGPDDGQLAAQLLVHHRSQNPQHGRPPVVQLHAALERLRLRVEGVPAEVQGAVAEVAGELVARALDVLHDAELQGADGEEELEGARRGDGGVAVDGGEAVGEGVEGVAGVVDVAREVDAAAGHDLAQEGEHGDAAVLDLD